MGRLASGKAAPRRHVGQSVWRTCRPAPNLPRSWTPDLPQRMSTERSQHLVAAATAVQPAPSAPRKPKKAAGSVGQHVKAPLLHGGQAHARIEQSAKHADVTITVSGLRTAHKCFLHWGLYRSSSQPPWLCPDNVIPRGSSFNETLGAIHTPLQADRTGRRGELTASLRIPKAVQPAFLAFKLYIADPQRPRFAKPLHGNSVVVPLGVGQGSPLRLGATVAMAAGTKWPAGPANVNFAVTSRHAHTMTLRIMRLNGGQVEKAMDLFLDPHVHRTGDIWHAEVRGLRGLDRAAYCWIASGEVGWRGRARYSPGACLLDPYATAAQYVQLPESFQGGVTVLAGLLPSTPPAAQPAGGVRPHVAIEDLVVVEIDPYTFASEGRVKVGREGKWLGVLQRISEIQALGANAVVLPCPMLREEGLGVQGRAAVSFFAIEAGYAVDPAEAAEDFKRLVQAFHHAGIQVIVQVEYCFTVEGDDTHPRIVGMRGLDAPLYYRPNSLLNLAHPTVQGLVLDSLRHWATEFHLDGFCLLSAESLAQDGSGTVLDCPPIAQAISQDPVLRGCKMVAWPRDARLLPRRGRRGFPHQGVLLQHNDRFGNVLAWLRGDSAVPLGVVASQLTGCAEVFQADWSPEAGLSGNLAAGRRPAFAINSASSPLVDGTTLSSWVDSFLGLGEGTGAVRLTLMKSALLAAIVAQGTPQLAAADLEARERARFATAALQARRQLGELLQPPRYSTPRELAWFNESGQEPAWGDATALHGVLGLCVRTGGALGKAACVLLNRSWEKVTVMLPPTPGATVWHVLVDSGSDAPHDTPVVEGGRPLQAGSTYIVAPKGALVLQAIERRPAAPGQASMAQGAQAPPTRGPAY